jgi:hypothetical protein
LQQQHSFTTARIFSTPIVFIFLIIQPLHPLLELEYVTVLEVFEIKDFSLAYQSVLLVI